MRRVHFFNPENDIALASGTANFTAPKAAIQLHNAGGALPLWWADSGDRLLAYGIDGHWLEEMLRRFELDDIDVYDHTSASGYVAAPWGWSAASRRTFEREGFSPDNLPDSRSIDLWRQLSHRRTASSMRNSIAQNLDFEIADAAIEVEDPDSLCKLLTRQPASILKSPWSSSGRGLIDTRRFSVEDVIRRARGIIKRQGSVMVEKAYNRMGDFAVLYQCRNGHCEFVGYSVFQCDSTGSYIGNALGNDSHLQSLIDSLYPIDKIERVARAICQYFDEVIAPVYDGPLGVDMFTADMGDGRILLNASVEVNLRMTMGRVALEFSRRHLAMNSIGFFRVIPDRHQTLTDGNICLEGKRLISGRMMLTPPGGQFKFVTEVTSCDSTRL